MLRLICFILNFFQVYATNGQVPDSAATITAILSGQKTNNGLINLNATIERGACDEELMKRTEIDNLFNWADHKGKALGKVIKENQRG